MRIVCASDLHGHLPEIPECDLLLIGGDVCPLGSEPDYGGSLNAQERWLDGPFTMWLHAVPATNIVGIAGNHDFIAYDFHEMMGDLPWTYLVDESVEIEGLKIWGSPYSNFLPGWVFMETDDKLAQRWEQIPDDVNILLIHGPARRLLDKCLNGDEAGSISLRGRLRDLPELKLFVCEHIHEAYGIGSYSHSKRGGEPTRTTVVNASHVNFPRYEPVNPPFIFDL